jgi:putative ABC transport system permease protein
MSSPRSPLGGLLTDIRHAFRTLLRAPGFTAVALTTLALGIGANTAIFSLVDAALLRGLPFREPGRLVAIWEKNPRSGNTRNVVASPAFTRWRERAGSFESMAAYAGWTATLSGADDAVRLPVGNVTPDFFRVLGVAPAVGRGFLDSDSVKGSPDVVVLGDALWRRRYGADPSVVGRAIPIDGRPTTVVGVMRPGIDLPVGAELWLPFTIDHDFRETNGRFLAVIGRLKPDVAVAQARAEMEVIAKAIEVERPQRSAGWGVTVTPLHDDLVTTMRGQLLLLMAGVALLLVMACVNVASLMLSRALTRVREFAIRSALGAGRGRLLRLFLTESLVLCALGAAAGLALAHATLIALVDAMPTEMPAFMAPRIGAGVLGFTVALCLASALATALIPALRLSGSPLAPALKEGSAGAGVGPARRRLRGLLVAGQMALALVLIAGGGLLLRSYLRLSGVDAGFDPRQVLTVNIQLPTAVYPEGKQQARFFQSAADALATIPGVRAAAGSSWAPMGMGSATSFQLPDRAAPPPGQEPGADVRFVTPGLFRVLGVPLKEGRDFTPEDAADRPRVAVVNQTLAARYWPGQSALGKRIRMEWDGMNDAEVVGVVGDVRLRALDVASRNTIYWPQSQIPTSFMSLMLKSDTVPPQDLAVAAAGAIRGLDKGLAMEIKPLESVVAGSLQRQSFTLALTMAFGVTAVLLASVGLFGVVAQAVGERRREFAVRLALGARRGEIRRLVVGEGFRWSAAGALVGLPVAIWAGHALSSFLFEVTPSDPATYGAVIAILASAALVAVVFPAWRAARVDPLVVLRSE